MFRCVISSWVRKLVKKLMESRTVDMMFMSDYNHMVKRKSGSRYFNYIALDGKMYRAKFRWWRTRHYIHFVKVPFHLGEQKLDHCKSHRFISIYMLKEKWWGLKIEYSNPESSLAKRK